MEVATFVTRGDTLQAVIGHSSDFRFIWLWYSLWKQLVQIFFHEFKDEVETVLLANDFFELDDIMVVKFT